MQGRFISTFWEYTTLCRLQYDDISSLIKSEAVLFIKFYVICEEKNMKKFNKFISVIAAVSVSAATCLSLPSTAAQTYDSACTRMLEIINKYRAEAGVQPLELYTGASTAANVRASECDVLFDHTRPNGSDCFSVLDEYNIYAAYYGENIYWCSAYDFDPDGAMEAWMNSQGHRENILRPEFEYVGLGHSSAAGSVWVQIFLQSPFVYGSSTGDIDGNGYINAIDASLVLQQYANDSTGSSFKQLDQFYEDADVNGDGIVNAADASAILKYYADESTGANPHF